MLKKENKLKNPVLYVVAGLLLLSCIATGIYALFTTGDTLSDSARAAKWGVEVTAEGDGSTSFMASYDGDSDLSVKSDDESSLIVAPGTEGYITFSITGKPEVAVDVDLGLGQTDGASPTLKMITGPSDAGADSKTYAYYPVQWTLKRSATSVDDWSTVSAISGCSGVSLSDINDYLQGEDVSKSFAPNTDLSSQYGYYQLSWTWPASQSKDAEDTYIGNVAAGTVTDANVSTNEAFSLSISVTQADTYEND